MANNIKFLFGSKAQILASTRETGRLLFATDEGNHIYWDNGGATLIDLYGTDLQALKTLIGTDSVATQITNAIGDTNGKKVVEMIEALEKEIKGDDTTVDPDAPTTKGLAERLEEAETAIEALQGTGEGSVKKAVADGIATVVAGADTEFDTLKEVAEWIKNDTTGAAKMQNDIAAIKEALGAKDGEGDGDDTPIEIPNVDDVVKEAIEALDVALDAAAGEGKYVASITQEDGKIKPVYADLPETNLTWGDLSELAGN